MEKDDIKNTEKYMDDSVLHKSDSDQGESSGEEDSKPKRQARRRTAKAQKAKEEFAETVAEPKPRRQPKSSRDGAPPKKKQSRDREKPAAVKKYEPKCESELAKSESVVETTKRSGGRPRLTEAERELRKAKLCSTTEKDKNLIEAKKDFLVKMLALAEEHKINGISFIHAGAFY